MRCEKIEGYVKISFKGRRHFHRNDTILSKRNKYVVGSFEDPDTSQYQKAHSYGCCFLSLISKSLSSFSTLLNNNLKNSLQLDVWHKNFKNSTQLQG